MKDIHSIFWISYTVTVILQSSLFICFGPTLFIQFVTNRIQLVITRPNTRTVVVMLSK